MGILKQIRLAWKKMDTLEKIGLVVDAVVGVGSGAASMVATAKLTEGRNVVEKICIGTAMSGLGLAAADVASDALKKNYLPLVGVAINRLRAKPEEEEDDVHE